MLPIADVVCPACRQSLDVARELVECAGCGARYPRVGDIAVLLPQPDAHVDLWRGQLGLLLERGEKTLEGLNEAAAGAGLSAVTRKRLTALGSAVKDQVADVAAVLGPALGGAGAPSGGLPRGVVEYIGYLYRDWGWPSAGYRENDAALATLAELLGARRLGRTLVLGAGACGLAYELHRRHGASETVVVDIDPYLLVIAERIIRGASVRLTEASLKVLDPNDVSRAWTLAAPAGPLSPREFQFLFADGVAPPFAPSSFDSVITPWFIDQVPRDLPAFMQQLAALLRPGGLWLNQGPLIYPEQIPFERRYSQDELFELATERGFTIAVSERASLPYLVSPLSGHGKVEAVLSFLAERPAAEKA
jgi:SAM-dependent methyltransferase